MFQPDESLSIGLIFRRFWARISVTWALTFVEITLFALLPLLIGWSIDGLLASDNTAFVQFCWALAALVVVSIGRRVYDTRAYGTVRVALGQAQAVKTSGQSVSKANARVLMGRELVDFLEDEAPQAMTAVVQVIASILILMSFHGVLATSAGAAAVLMLIVFGLSSRRFFRLNGALNAQTEQQVSALESRDVKRITAHFTGLRRQEVRLSDWESLIYGLIFTILLSMLLFNLWYGATELATSPGAIFSIVMYSFEFVESAVVLPTTLQSLTRLKEITQRINQTESESD